MNNKLYTLESVKNINLKNNKTLTILFIFFIVLFAIIYIWLSKTNNIEGFSQYNVNSGDLVSLYGLDNVVVGSSNPLTLTNTLNNLIDTRNARTLNNTYAKITDLTNTNMNLTSNVSTIQSNISNLENALTRQINNLNNSINSKYEEYNRMFNNFASNFSSNFDNTVILIGLINYAPVLKWTYYYNNNNDGNGNYLLGKQINTSELITVPISNFNNSIFNSISSSFIDSPIKISYFGGGSIICIFDWINDSNIYFNKNNISVPKPVIYTSVYPINTNFEGKLQSPFNVNTFKPGATYLFNIYHSKFWNTSSAIYCILFKSDGSKNINLIHKFFTNENTNHVSTYNQYIITTTPNSINIGIYVITTNENGVQIDSNDQASICVYQIKNTSQLSITTTPNTTTILNTTTPVTTRPT